MGQSPPPSPTYLNNSPYPASPPSSARAASTPVSIPSNAKTPTFSPSSTRPAPLSTSPPSNPIRSPRSPRSPRCAHAEIQIQVTECASPSTKPPGEPLINLPPSEIPPSSASQVPTFYGDQLTGLVGNAITDTELQEAGMQQHLTFVQEALLAPRNISIAPPNATDAQKFKSFVTYRLNV